MRTHRPTEDPGREAEILGHPLSKGYTYGRAQIWGCRVRSSSVTPVSSLWSSLMRELTVGCHDSSCRCRVCSCISAPLGCVTNASEVHVPSVFSAYVSMTRVWVQQTHGGVLRGTPAVMPPSGHAFPLLSTGPTGHNSSLNMEAACAPKCL
jgi:hypothetical protein